LSPPIPAPWILARRFDRPSWPAGIDIAAEGGGGGGGAPGRPGGGGGGGGAPKIIWEREISSVSDSIR